MPVQSTPLRRRIVIVEEQHRQSTFDSLPITMNIRMSKKKKKKKTNTRTSKIDAVRTEMREASVERGGALELLARAV